MQKYGSVQRPPILGLLVDVSGNLHVGSTPTPNAVEAFHKLRQSPIPFRLCSNTSKESTAALIKRLNAMGFDIFDVPTRINAPKLVWTSIGAVAQCLKDKHLRRPFVLLSDSARKEVFDEIGYSAENQVEGLSRQEEKFDSVVIGLSPSHLDYKTLNMAFRILKGEQPADGNCSASDRQAQDKQTLYRKDHIPLIATHKAKYIETQSGLSLGPGPFVTALETATDTTAHVIGKPTKAFFDAVIKDFTTAELEEAARFQVNTYQDSSLDGRIVVIGDDVQADLSEGAIELGLWRVLVKTGKYRAGDENKPGVVPPDEVFNSFAAFVDSLLDR